MRHLSRAHGLAVGFVFLAALICFASKQFVMPTVRDAQTYPAHDIHNDEKVSIAADPYDTNEKSAIFTQKYAESGYLPVFLVVTNNGDEPVSVQSLRVELVTGNRTKILPASMDDLYRRFSKVKRRGDEPRTNPLPYPFPKKGPQAGTDRHRKRRVPCRHVSGPGGRAALGPGSYLLRRRRHFAASLRNTPCT